jgi:hypothetical protein
LPCPQYFGLSLIRPSVLTLAIGPVFLALISYRLMGLAIR